MRHIMILGEYDAYDVSPIDKRLYSVVSGYVPGAPVGILGGSASLHHAGFIGPDRTLWAIGDNSSNASGTGATGSTIGMTKTPVTNVKQVQAYCNGGDPGGLGNGIASLTVDGKVILTGNTQSGFRGDGTEGNAAETAPFTVNLPEPITKIAVGGYCFALGVSGKVYQWGGTRQDSYWSQFSCGRLTASPKLTTIAILSFPEAIVDIEGGSDTNYAIGSSGKIYGWAYYPVCLGLQNTPTQFKIFDLTSTLNLPGTLTKLVTGTEATYALMSSGDLYSWGNNTQAACANGQEGVFPNFTAPWGITSSSLFVYTPYRINSNPVLTPGIKFVDVFAAIGDVFYAYAEDASGNIYAWGRNKGAVIPDGKNTGSSQDQANTPNKWDVLSPEKLNLFPPSPSTTTSSTTSTSTTHVNTTSTTTSTTTTSSTTKAPVTTTSTTTTSTTKVVKTPYITLYTDGTWVKI